MAPCTQKDDVCPVPQRSSVGSRGFPETQGAPRNLPTRGCCCRWPVPLLSPRRLSVARRREAKCSWPGQSVSWRGVGGAVTVTPWLRNADALPEKSEYVECAGACTTLGAPGAGKQGKDGGNASGSKVLARLCRRKMEPGAQRHAGGCAGSPSLLEHHLPGFPPALQAALASITLHPF